MRRLIFFIVFMIGATTTFAQGKFGVKAGADLYKLDGKAFKDQFSFGYNIGVFAELSLSKQFSIQPEVLFGQNTVDTSSTFSDIYGFNSIKNVKLTYLKIPLLLNYKVNNVIYLQAGPQYSILMDQNISLIENGKSAFKKGNLTMLGGLQLNIAKINLYGRYGIGLSDLNDIDNKDKWKSQSVQIGVGYSL